MNGKPVLGVPAKSVINFASGFEKKLLCDGLTFSTGDACTYSCTFCYVPSVMLKRLTMLKKTGKIPESTTHAGSVILREGAIEAMRSQLAPRGTPKFKTPGDARVIYSSPLVDVAGNMSLVNETIEACELILELTNWQIRLLSKSNLLPKIAKALGAEGKARVIYGVSTGTFDDKLAAAFEVGTPLVSKRVESLHWLQDNGYRTFGMVCPSLPQRDYLAFSQEAAEKLRTAFLEHVWAEVINVRGESMTDTHTALDKAGYHWEASQLLLTSKDKDEWEDYARRTWFAHQQVFPHAKLRFLQYLSADNKQFWTERQSKGVVLL